MFFFPHVSLFVSASDGGLAEKERNVWVEDVMIVITLLVRGNDLKLVRDNDAQSIP